MMLKPWLRTALISCGVVILAACSTHKKHDDAAIEDANAAYSSDSSSSAQTSGVEGGESTGFADESDQGQAAGQTQNKGLSQRVYYFEYDSSAVHEEDRPAITANADYLLQHNTAKIILEGHTDPRGSREYNIGLGERRAKSIAEILTAKGVSPAQIRVVSYGAEKLASAGHSEEDFQQDRRVVIVYLKQ